MIEDWPAPQRSEHPPLPTTHDLPLAPEGYDPESVEAAFGAFYRHISQLDTTLRALEAFESFRLYAGELRADLRSIRAAGWTPYPRGYPSLPAAPGSGFAMPEALPRLVLEIAFLVVVAVVAAVGGFSAVAIIVVMAVAVTLAAGFELLVSSSWRPMLTRTPAPVPVAAAVLPMAPHAPVVLEAVPAADGAGWAAFAESPAVEGKTVVDSVETDAPVEEAGESTAEIEAMDEAEPSLIRDLAPWERGFDGDPERDGGKEDEAPVAR